MSDQEEQQLSAEDLWEYCLLEYNSENPITRLMINSFFSRIGEIIELLEFDDRILEVGCGAGESSRRILSFLSGQHFEISEADCRWRSLERVNSQLR